MYRVFAIIMTVFLVAGCSALPGQSSEAKKATSTQPKAMSPRAELALVEPVQASQARQAEAAQLSQLLEGRELSKDQRAVVHYRRGIVYDALGLPAMALLDMNLALEIDPAMAEAWHYLGVYYMQHGNYPSAYESFDSVIELKPNHDFVYLNRGLTSYYDGQYEFAVNDFADYYFQDPSDPYRIAWYYFAAYEVDSGRAEEQLQQQLKAVPADSWGGTIVRFLAGIVDEPALVSKAFNNIESHEDLVARLCEAYFYLGKKAAMAGDSETALNYFKLTIMTNVYPFIEHRVARTELYRLREAAAE